MKYWCYIGIAAITGISGITITALRMGHDNMLVTGAVSAIVGISAGVAAYFKGKTTGGKTISNGHIKKV